MELKLVNDLFESRLFNSRNSMARHTVEDVANMTFLNFLAIQILKSEFDTADFASDYLYQSFKSGNFNTLQSSSTDLFWMIHVLSTKNIDMLNGDHGNENEIEKIHLDDNNLKIWARTAIKNKTTESTDRRFLIALEKMLNIRTADYRYIRQLVAGWITLSDEQRQLAMTRLLFAIRKKMPRSELLPLLEHLAHEKKLEIKNANNPEEDHSQPTKGSLVKKLAIAAAVGAAVGLPIMGAVNRYKSFKSRIDAIPVGHQRMREDVAATSAGSIATVTQPMFVQSRVKRGDRRKKVVK